MGGNYGAMKQIIAIFAALALLTLGVAMLRGVGADVQSPATLSDEDLARMACRDGMGDLLHDPTRAVWEGWEDWPVEMRGNEATVQMAFRAPNAFGAIVRARAVCDAMRFVDGWVHWSIERVP